MSKIIRIKNTGIINTWLGQSIDTNEYIDLNDQNAITWANDSQVFTDVNSGVLVINNGTDTINDLTPLAGWKWLSADTSLPVSDLDGIKLAVHSSNKPKIDNSETYVVWSGSGDNTIDGSICDGELLEFNMAPGISEKIIDVKFDQTLNGRVWIHEGYLKFENGGSGDHMNAEVISEVTPLQQSVNLDLVVDVDGWISYAPGGAGTGTHGFADPTKIVLIPKTFSKNGQWDYDGVSLIPNQTDTGGYKLSTNECVIHRYMNKIPVRGACSSYFSMTSDETSEIFKNYFLRMSAFNASNTTWHASVIMELFRERTYNP